MFQTQIWFGDCSVNTYFIQKLMLCGGIIDYTIPNLIFTIHSLHQGH